MADVLEKWGLSPVINAAGTMTAIGSSRVLPEIAADIGAIMDEFVRIDDLQARASAQIAAVTGAEAGYVTGSSAAGITLSVAAALTGDDLAAIEGLPATGDMPRRVGIQMGHMVNYGAPVPQAIALCGAEVVPLGTAALCEGYHLEAALRDGLAAAVFVVSHHTVREGELPLDLFIETCRRQQTPVIVDMASEYDLTGPIALGADAVVYSGHKFLGGPTSGIIAGRRQMIRAVALQSRGIGRITKAGKEGIVGAMAALAAWSRRDHAAMRRAEEAIVDVWMTALAAIEGVTARRHADWTGNPITRVELQIDPEAAGLFAWELAARLLETRPAIAVRDDLAEHQRLYLDPCNLTRSEAETVARRIDATISAARAASNGRRIGWSEMKRRRAAASVTWLEGDG